MGKINKKRRSRPDSDLVPEELKDDELELSANSQENVIQTILDQLQSPNMEEKYCGLQTFATLIEDQSRTQDVLKSGVIKAAAPMLLDGNASVRNSAAGALNNLSRCGFDVCDSMMEQDIVTPLIAYFHEYAAKLAPKGNKSNKFDEDGHTFINCVNILMNLCENSGLAVKYFNASSVLPILVKHLDFDTFGSDITISVLQCLFVVSEDNVIVTEKIRAECEETLQKLLQIEGSDPSDHLIRTLTAGIIIINTCGGNITSLPLETINKIMSILASTLSLDHRQACNDLSNKVPVSDGTKKLNELKGKEGQFLASHIKSVTQLLNAQQTSVEIIANVFSCENNEDIMDTDDSSDSEDMADENVLDNPGNSESVTVLDKLPPEVSEAMASYEIFEKVWSKTILPPDNTMMIISEYENSTALYDIVSNLQTRALLCVNNMLSSLPLTNLGGVPGVYKIWVNSGKYAFKQSNEKLMESATAVMRSALCRIKEEKVNAENLFGELPLVDVEILLSGAKECSVPEVRSNLIRMLGSLALLLISSAAEKTTDIVAGITGFIFDQAHKVNEVWVMAECVDTLLDLYAEDETDALAARTNLVQRLTQLAPVLNNKARQQRKRLGEHGALVRTAVSNLPRFITYKRERLASLTRHH